MAEVEIRDATPGDAPGMAVVWAAGIPYYVRTAASIQARMRYDGRLGRRRLVAILDGAMAGTAIARHQPGMHTMLELTVMPEHRNLGVGGRLLEEVLDWLAARDAGTVVAIANGDEASLGFATAHGFTLGNEGRVSRVDPRDVPDPGEPPTGLRPLPCDLVDPDAILDAHNACAGDDPSGYSPTLTREEFLADWWDSPDAAAELSWALMDDGVVAAFSAVSVDRERGRAWSSMTGTRPSYRGRHLATWLKRRILSGLAAAGVTAAWTGNDASNRPMLAVNEALGYRPAGSTFTVRR